MASPALANLRSSRIPELRALLALRPRRDRLDPASVTTADAVNRACVVVLSAHLEGFVEDLIDDIIDALNSNGPATRDIPTILLGTHVSDELSTIASMTDPYRQADRIRAMFVTYSPLWLSENLSPGNLRSEAVTATLGNPGAKEIARALGLVGMSAVFVSIQMPRGADPEKRLNELVGIRNAIAHGGWPSLTDAQVDSYVSSVEAICEGLHGAAAIHVQQVCQLPTLPWP